MRHFIFPPTNKPNLLTLFIFLLGFAFLSLICWFFWVLSGAALLVLVPALLLNIFYFLMAYSYINELLEKKLITQREPNQNFDKNESNEGKEERLWELEKKLKFSSLWQNPL